MPVMALRALRPCRRTTVAKAASYKPQPIARPSSNQPTTSIHGATAAPSSIKPVAKSRLLAINTGRPPKRSIARPASGPARPETNSATENIANTRVAGKSKLAAIGAARIAGM